MDNLSKLYDMAVSIKEERAGKKIRRQRELRASILESFDKERCEQLALCAEAGLIPKPKGFWTWKCPYCKIKLERVSKWIPENPPSKAIYGYAYRKCRECSYEYAEISKLDDYYEGWTPLDI